MKPNVLKKIAFLVYCSIIILICVFFVPYHGTYNGWNPMEGNYPVNGSYHSSILDEGYGSISYFSFLFYLGFPGFLFCFLIC